ncbi:TetR/AcrR family transcriptional regulator [Levilactobacillus tongjiangensis]|uniref:TetR/AcrR family transcriptional regulator n=1 Tax=Levilactobacillus tongjiangensis TaxID=2486023 RepID=A0ABW1SSF3_9LACO|nr:TetR/AcrR family transcriptional regulator [Levilactobacillus tongjiangensis]
MVKETNIQTAFQEVMAASGNIPPKQKQVLAASLSLFAEKGFASTTTKEIAERAGVAEGTVYRRYRTKDELLAGVLAPFMTEVLPKLVSEFAEKVVGQTYSSRHDLVATVVNDRMQFVVENQSVLRILVTEILVRNDLRDQTISRMVPLLKQNLYPVLDHLKAIGELVDWPNDRIAQFMIGTMLTQLVRSTLTNEEVTSAASLIIKFLEKGLAPE